MNEYQVTVRLANRHRPLEVTVRAACKEHAVLVAGTVLGATGNYGGTSAVESIETKLMRRG